MPGVLLAGKSLGPTLKWNASWDAIWRFFVFAQLDRSWSHLYFLSKYNLSKCPNKNKFKVHWILSLEESKIKKLTWHLQRLLQLRPKKHGSFRNCGKKGTNGSRLIKNRTKWNCWHAHEHLPQWSKSRGLHSWKSSFALEPNNSKNAKALLKGSMT